MTSMPAITGPELAFSPDGLAVEIGWVLSNARLYATDPRLQRASQFSASISPPVHRAQIGRWESGTTSVSHAQVRRYEVVLGLPEGQLLTMVDLLARERQLTTAQPYLVPVRPPTWEDETDDLLDLARSDDRMTPLQWRTLSTHLGSVTTTFLRRDDWTHLLRRVSLEASLSTGLDYILRDVAKLSLASHPRSTRAVLDMVDEVLSDPVAPVYGETLGLLLAVPGPEPVELVLRHLRNPIGPAAHFSLMWMARSMVNQAVVSPRQLTQMGRYAVEALDDSTASHRVHRSAASFLEVLDGPERCTVVADLLSETTRRRVGRIIEHGGALGDEQVTTLADEVERRLAAAQSPRGALHPVFASLLRTAAGLSAEDSRGTALSLLMLSPQRDVVGETYARALRWALEQDREPVIDEALSVLAWLLPPTAVPWMLELAFDPSTEPTRATQALVSVANAQTPMQTAPEGYGPDDVVEMVRRSALALMTDPGPEPDVSTRGHLYLLGMYGRFDAITGLADAAARPGVPPQWALGIRSWLEVPLWARPERVR